jgi:hypothetical protein
MAEDRQSATWRARMGQTLQWLFGQQQDQQQQVRLQQERQVQDGYIFDYEDPDNSRRLGQSHVAPQQPAQRTSDTSRESVREAEAQRHALQQRIDAQREAQERGRGWGMGR